MDYEKKYKETLERARQFSEHPLQEDSSNIVEYIFPELQESKDERIRKEIIETFKNLGDGKIPVDINYADIFTWLEKQDKQPSAIRWYDVSLIPREMEELLVEWDGEEGTWHEIAFYHADTKTFWDYTRQVENVTRWCYIIDLLEKQGDANKEYWRGYREGKQEILNKYAEVEKQGEQKPAWSENDVYNSKLILSTISQDQDLSLETKDKLTSWLKSLKDRYTWKPSDEQMHALHDLNLTGNISYAGQGQVLIELYNDLKKLTE